MSRSHGRFSSSMISRSQRSSITHRPVATPPAEPPAAPPPPLAPPIPEAPPALFPATPPAPVAAVPAAPATPPLPPESSSAAPQPASAALVKRIAPAESTASPSFHGPARAQRRTGMTSLRVYDGASRFAAPVLIPAMTTTRTSTPQIGRAQSEL